MNRITWTRLLWVTLSLFISVTMFQHVALCANVTQISMGTATVGGIFPEIGIPVATCVNAAWREVNITAEFTEGSVENLRLLSQKKMQISVISPQIAYFARKAMANFKDSPIDVSVIVRLIPNTNIWVALEGSEIKTFADLRGKKVGVGPASGGLGTYAQLQLAGNGIDYKKDIKPYFMGVGEMTDALKDKTIDAAILTVGAANVAASTHKIRVISWAENDVKTYVDKYPYCDRYVLPANYFKGVNYPVLTLDNGVQLICRTDEDDAFVYKLTKTIIENLKCIWDAYAPAKEMTREFAASELANPFHPAAIRYFKEVGLMKK
jgi:TRAP transporter TAXI family solute receptor